MGLEIRSHGSVSEMSVKRSKLVIEFYLSKVSFSLIGDLHQVLTKPGVDWANP